MKKLIILAALFFNGLLAAQVAIIPEPVSLVTSKGKHALPKQLVLVGLAETAASKAYLSEKLKDKGFIVSETKSGKGHVYFTLAATAEPNLGTEGYKLSVMPTGIFIRANAPAGLFYGVQTLLQLFPAAIEKEGKTTWHTWSVPNIKITDYPRFAWRGLMLDVSRHFFNKEEVKRYIDEMARYKFNLFHWHLADDEGWRVEIKSQPKLTAVGSWNVKREGHFGDFSPIGPDEPRTNGGFYTQEDIKEVVAYAQKRFVSILPEIDMPGHSLAAIASYPELSCTPDAVNYKVSSGEPIMAWPPSGHFTAIYDNILCPANEKVYPFVDNVIGELAQLFPFPYIHVGGDECAFNFWEQNEEIKALMLKENLTTMQQVQGYFERRVEAIVQSKGKKMIGWDEILEGGVSPTTAIMNWQNISHGVKAIAEGHEVVLSPTAYCYLDYMQSDAIMEPRVYASLRLSKVYGWEPASGGISDSQIKGIQGNLWTEQVYNFRQVQYMTWPRAFAMSETAWSPASKKDWTKFIGKIERHFRRFNEAEIKYAPAVYDPIFKAALNENKQLTVTLSTEIKDLDIYYSFDNSEPDRFYPKYENPIVVPVDATQLRVITYRGKEKIGRMNNMPVETLKKRAK